MGSYPELHAMSSFPSLAPSIYPSPSEAHLKLQYVGKQIKDVPAPATILDVAVIRRNCRMMLDTVAKLGVGFRAHVKTHKTTQLAKLQVGEDSKSVKLVASTVAEIENLAPWLLECRQAGKEVNVLLGLPITPSAIPRLAAVVRILGEGTVGVFVDHPGHVKLLEAVDEQLWPGMIPAFINIDIGYHREGVPADSQQLAEIAHSLAKSHKKVRLTGFYTHFGSSYEVKSPEEAVKSLSTELQGLKEGATAFLKHAGFIKDGQDEMARYLLSLGATPTATSAQNILDDTENAMKYRAEIDMINRSFEVELHAGVYPVMDMQQLATRARPQFSISDPNTTMLSFSDVGVRTLVEVASLYPQRGSKPEALVAGGSIVFGREPCKSYPGWGVVTPWPAKSGTFYDPEGSRTGWIIGRISQEHGILTWEGPTDEIRHLDLGDKLLVWPNHACIAGVNFGWYLVIDSDKVDPEKIVDVWTRWRGW